MATEKSIKPANLVPRSFGGEKNNFSDDLIVSGFEPNTPQTYNGDNLNYQLNATGKELDYCEKVVDYINGLGVGKTPIVNANNKLDETQVGVKVYNATETFGLGEWVKGTVDDVVGLHESLKPANVGNALTDATSWKKVKFGDEGANVDLSNLSTTGQAKFDEKVDLNASNLNTQGKSYVSGLGMPSNKYIDLTLGASGSTYTAPANGYFCLAKTVGVGQYIAMYGTGGQRVITAPGVLIEATGTLPVKKDDTIQISYTGTGAVTVFRFIYAEGSK